MKNIVLDTCVFFGMLWYYKTYKRHGESGLADVLEDQRKDLKKARNAVARKYGEVFKKKYKDLSFDEAVDRVKEQYNNKKKNYAKKIASYELIAKGIDPKTGERTIPVARQLDVLLFQLPKLKIQNRKYCQKVDSDAISTYKNLRNSYENGLLFSSIVKGELKPFLVPPSFDEVLDHTQPKNDNPKWRVVDKKLVDGMMNDFVTLISTHSEQFLQDVDNLAKKFRKPTGNEKSKEMAEDINSNDVYGDSLIMAWANMVGMPLVTQNIKDFIRNKKIKQYNDCKRKNIEAVAKETDYATDALPYSPREILDGNFQEAQRQNSVYELSETTALDYDYSIPRMKGTEHMPSAKLAKDKKEL